MLYTFRVLTPNTPNTPCNSALSVIDYATVNVKLINSNIVICDGALSTAIPATFNVISKNGNQLSCTGSVGLGYVLLSLPIAIGDSVNLSVELSSPTNVYNTYTNVFTLYHYDLGIPLIPGTQPNMDIVLISSTTNHPYSGVIAYRKPFTTLIHFYKNNSSKFDAITLYDENDDLMSNLSFGTLCLEEDKEFYYITSLGSEICTQSVNAIVNSIKWLPDYEVTSDCVANCTPDCVTPLSSNTVTINIDYNTLDTILIDGVESYPYISQSLVANVIDSSGTVIFTNVVTNNIEFGLTSLTYSYVSPVFSIPSSGDYIIQGCINIFGYEAQGIYNGIPNVGITYKQLNVLSAADFTGCGGDAVLGTQFTANGNAPTDWSTFGKLIEIINSGTPVINKYYKVFDYDITANFTNLIITDSASIKNGMLFYADGTAPTSWGATACIIETLPIYTCCSSITMRGCNVYTVTQSNCNTVNITNNSFSDLDYSLSMLTATGWVVVTTDVVSALTTLPIELSTDGVYDITISYAGVDEHFIKVISCAIETCKLEYLNKLMCCNAGKNCDPCDECSTQDNYDFNAFSILMQTYFMLVNIVTNIDYSYSTTQLSTAEVLNNLYNIVDILAQANKYCTTCDEPCSNCE